MKILLACTLLANSTGNLYSFHVKTNEVPRAYINNPTNILSSKFNLQHVTAFQESKHGDYYIDRLTGKILGRDRAATNNLRVIDKREWDYVLKEKGGPRSKEGIKELHKNSSVIVFDEDQIQKEIQILGEDTALEGLEHQLYIVLDVNTGQVFAKREFSPNRIFKTRSIIEVYKIGKISAPRIAEGLMLLAEVHGHPRTINFYEINIEAASEIDKEVARDLNINIFVVDAFDTKLNSNYPRAIHRVNNTGNLATWVGHTIGINSNNTFNFTDYLSNMLREDTYAF
ncbi:hypothetical protein [Aquimarina sp. 2304DJ70-9]|uniref:hypothetical protein n=1 Tax=Aquimarina penaris TaxID=3231044 RepID=UPI00346215C5